jgi:hypothetical protein
MRRMRRTLAALLLAAASPAFAWTPPAHPNPQAILQEAVEDRVAGRYEDALQKQLWFHKEAVKIQPALVGVRSSFALAYWAHLAAKYPPALEALKKVRAEAEQDVRAGREPVQAFGDVAAINNELDDPLARNRTRRSRASSIRPRRTRCSTRNTTRWPGATWIRPRR